MRYKSHARFSQAPCADQKNQTKLYGYQLIYIILEIHIGHRVSCQIFEYKNQESPGWISLFKFVIFSFFFENIQKSNFSTFQLFKLSKLCYHFCRVLEMKTIFFYIPSYPPPIAIRNSLTNQFVPKK